MFPVAAIHRNGRPLSMVRPVRCNTSLRPGVFFLCATCVSNNMCERAGIYFPHGSHPSEVHSHPPKTPRRCTCPKICVQLEGRNHMMCTIPNLQRHSNSVLINNGVLVPKSHSLASSRGNFPTLQTAQQSKIPHHHESEPAHRTLPTTQRNCEERKQQQQQDTQ